MDSGQGDHRTINPGDRARKRQFAVYMLLAAAFLWGSGNVANKTVLQDLDPFATVVARNVVATVVLFPFAVREMRLVPNRWGWARSALLPSVFFAVAIILQQWAYQSATVTNASFLVNTASILTPILAFIATREQLQPGIGVAAVLTLPGAFLLSGAGRSLSDLNVGDVACLISAAFYAAWMVALSKHAQTQGRAVATTFLHVTLTVAFATVIVTILQPVQPGTWAGAMPELLYLGVLSTALAFALTAAAQAHVAASTTAVLVAAESLFGAAGGILILGERPGQVQLIGAGVMLLAIVMVARATCASVGQGNPILKPEQG